MGELAAGLRNVNAALEGPVWQGALTTVFQGAHDAMTALGPGVSNLANAFLSLAPTLAEIMVLAGQIGSVALTTVAPPTRPAWTSSSRRSCSGSSPGWSPTAPRR